MRTVAGSDVAQPVGTLFDLTDKVKIQVANAADALVDLTEFAVSLEYDQSTDEIVDAATVVFRRLEGASSLAPLMTASPPVALGRRIVVSVNPGGGTYREVFRGKIDIVDWPERFGDVTVQCRDQAGVPADTWIEDAREYGSTAGVSLETVMQAVADDNLTSSFTLNFPVATSAVVQHIAGDPPYGPTEQSVLDALRALAESIGWTIRWRNFDATPSDWKWTVFLPSRTKTVPDHTFGTSAYWDVTTIKQEIADIRNVVEVEYIGPGETLTSVTVSDSASITKYGRRYMKITEGSDSPVNNVTLATALANAALSDLKEPDALLEIECRYFWPGEVGVDLYRFSANEVHFTDDQDLAVMALRHRIATGERPTTWILTRGKPSGGVLMWRRRMALGAALPEVPTLRVSNFREIARSDTTVTFGWDVAGTITELWLYLATYPSPVASDPWAAMTGVPSIRLTGATTSYNVPIPVDGSITYGRLVPIDADIARGQAWDFTTQRTGANEIPQGSIAISSAGVVTAEVDGPTWMGSVKWKASTSAYPTDADTVSTGTTAAGTQLVIATGVTLDLGATVYVTVVPFSSTGAAGLQGSSMRLTATRHDATATKTVFLAASSFIDEAATSRITVTNGYVTLLAASGVQVEAYATFIIPSGVTVTGASFDLYTVNSGTAPVNAGVGLYRVGATGATTELGSATSSDFGGWEAKTITTSELTTGRYYRMRLKLLSDTVATDARCSGYSVTYTMPSTVNAL